MRHWQGRCCIAHSARDLCTRCAWIHPACQWQTWGRRATGSVPPVASPTAARCLSFSLLNPVRPLHMLAQQGGCRGLWSQHALKSMVLEVEINIS